MTKEELIHATASSLVAYNITKQVCEYFPSGEEAVGDICAHELSEPLDGAVNLISNILRDNWDDDEIDEDADDEEASGEALAQGLEIINSTPLFRMISDSLGLKLAMDALNIINNCVKKDITLDEMRAAAHQKAMA